MPICFQRPIDTLPILLIPAISGNYANWTDCVYKFLRWHGNNRKRIASLHYTTIFYAAAAPVLLTRLRITAAWRLPVAILPDNCLKRHMCIQTGELGSDDNGHIKSLNCRTWHDARENGILCEFQINLLSYEVGSEKRKIYSTPVENFTNIE